MIIRNLIALALTLLLAYASISSSAQECDPRCATENCDSDGNCICEVPDSSTLLEGDRLFMGGEFCDKEHIMCDGSNSFWCENGATCNEIVQGENYTCSCANGYLGQHCELAGIPCGDSFCYHEAECLQTEILCDCPPQWKGIEDCSLPTEKSSANKTNVGPLTTGTREKDKPYVSAFSAAVGVIVVVLLVVLGRKLYEKRAGDGMQFHNRRQVQMHGFIDNDDEAFSHEPLTKRDDL